MVRQITIALVPGHSPTVYAPPLQAIPGPIETDFHRLGIVVTTVEDTRIVQIHVACRSDALLGRTRHSQVVWQFKGMPASQEDLL